MFDDVIYIIACNKDDFECDFDMNSNTMFINSINVNEKFFVLCDMRVNCN